MSNLGPESTQSLDIQTEALKSLNHGTGLQIINHLIQQADAYFKTNNSYIQEGIMRLSGSKPEIEKSYKAIMKKPSAQTLIDHGANTETFLANHNNVSGLVKYALENMEHSSSDYSDEAINILKEFKDNLLTDNAMAIEELIKRLVEANAYEEAKFFHNMMYLSKQVSDQEEHNKMTKQNVAIAIAGPRFMNFIDEATAAPENPAAALTELPAYQKIVVNSIDAKNSQGGFLFDADFDQKYPNEAHSLMQQHAQRYRDSKSREVLSAQDLEKLIERGRSALSSMQNLLKKINPLKWFKKKSKKTDNEVDKMAVPPELAALRQAAIDARNEQAAAEEPVQTAESSLRKVSRFCREYMELKHIAHELKQIANLSDEEYYFDTISKEDVKAELEKIKQGIEKAEIAGAKHYIEFKAHRESLLNMLRDRAFETSSISESDIRAKLEEVEEILHLYEGVKIDKVAEKFRQTHTDNKHGSKVIQPEVRKAMKTAFTSAQKQWRQREQDANDSEPKRKLPPIPKGKK